MKSINKVAILSLITPLLFSVTSCDDLFEPAIENHKDMSQLEDMPSWAVGLLGHAYISNPLNQSAIGYSFEEVATDDAVSNNVDNTYKKMAAGAWSADNNPVGTWQYLRASWQYINQFLEVSENVQWTNDPLTSDLYKMRFQGDACGMRALYMLHLLKTHAGFDANGNLLGIPIILSSEGVNSDFNKPRNTFNECMKQLLDDVQTCIDCLPEDYGDIDDDSQIPAKYTKLGVTKAIYNRVFGDHAKNRMNPKVARAIRSQAVLMAASPAFEQSGYTWDDAAKYSAEVLAFLGSNPVAEMDTTGNVWYAEDQKNFEKIVAGYNRKEFLWRSNKDESYDLEESNFPPSLFGTGRVNPTQNLVDAFPMANGYPITDEVNSGYDPTDPYTGRDPRLDLYIIHNGSTFKGKTISTVVGGGEVDNKDNKGGYSTLTGYYMRKLLTETANPDPNSNTKAIHIKPWIRYTEIFLNYAEAANEAYGPKGNGPTGFSAYDVIKAIRERAGITSTAYLDACAASKDKMRALIRNERRIELCFEGFRFWDLRRWKEDLNVAVKGINIDAKSGDCEVVELKTELRKYESYMYYGPIPYSEVLKFDQLQQNAGWGK